MFPNADSALPFSSTRSGIPYGRLVHATSVRAQPIMTATTAMKVGPTGELPDVTVRLGPRSLLERIQHVLHSHPALSPTIVLVLACGVFGFLNEIFRGHPRLTRRVAAISERTLSAGGPQA